MKISAKVLNIRKAASKAKTLLVKLPLKQKLIFGSIAVVVLGGVLATSVIALNGNSQPQVVKTAPVAQVKKTPTKKVADASTTTPAATAGATQSTNTQPSSTATPATTPTSCPSRTVATPSGCKDIAATIAAGRTTIPTTTRPVAPVFTVDPLQITVSRYARHLGTINVSSSTALNWTFTYSASTLDVTGQPAGPTTSFTLDVGGAEPDEGTAGLFIIGTDPVTKLSTTQMVTFTLNNDPSPGGFDPGP